MKAAPYAIPRAFTKTHPLPQPYTWKNDIHDWGSLPGIFAPGTGWWGWVRRHYGEEMTACSAGGIDIELPGASFEDALHFLWLQFIHGR